MLEAEHVGFGASGRNGGWVSALWPVGRRHRSSARYGRTATLAQLAALRDTVDEVGRVDAEEGLDAGFVKGGALVVARTPAQEARARAAAAHSAVVGRRHGLAGCRRRPRAPRRRRGPRCHLHPALRPGAPAPARRRPGRRGPPAGRAGSSRGPAVAARPATGSSCSPTGSGSRPRTSSSPPRAGPARSPGCRGAIAPVYSLMVATEPIDDRALGRGSGSPGARCSPTTVTSSSTASAPTTAGSPSAGGVRRTTGARTIRPEFDQEPTRLRRAAHDAARAAPPARRRPASPTRGAARSASPATGTRR